MTQRALWIRELYAPFDDHHEQASIWKATTWSDVAIADVRVYPIKTERGPLNLLDVLGRLDDAVLEYIVNAATMDLSNQEFFDAYRKRHWQVFDEDILDCFLPPGAKP